MNEALDFIYQQKEEERELLLYFHNLLTNQFNLAPKIRYKVPFYYNKSWMIYLNLAKKGGVELSFIRGNELPNSQGLLEAKGRKQVMSVSFQKGEDLPYDALVEVINEAVLLDETIPYSLKRKN